jgi:large subunit ribosomal protein L38e
MPVFVLDENRFIDIAKNAVECRIKKLEKKGIVKFKARTKRYLYTYTVTADKAEALIEKLKSICKSVKEL